MTQFIFIGEPYPSPSEQEESIASFYNKLGPFKEEFDQSGAVVTFNYSFPETDTNRATFSFDKDHDVSNFILRVQEYNRKNKE
jgi:hypothetical protein